MSKTEKAIQWMESHANGNSHGYDKRYRWGEKGDFDYSYAVISACLETMALMSSVQPKISCVKTV